MLENVEMFKIAAIPIIAALIGWMTNWIAIKMLFHPRKPIDLYFFTLHGVFYKKQKKLAQNLAKTIEDKLFSVEDIKKVISTPDFIDGIKTVFEQYIDDFVKNKLASLHPMIAMIPEEMLLKFKDKISDEFEKFIPNLLDIAVQGLEKNLNIKELIREKIEAFDVSQLEEIIVSIMKSELKHIEYVGGVLGFFIGLTQIGILKLL